MSMKMFYQAPEGEIIDFRALERIAKSDDPDKARAAGDSEEVNPGIGGVISGILGDD